MNIEYVHVTIKNPHSVIPVISPTKSFSLKSNFTEKKLYQNIQANNLQKTL